MTLEELKENLTSSLKQSSERFKETSLYHQLSDRFENMKASQQKMAILMSVALVGILLFFIPVTSLLSSKSSIVEFESQRELIRDLIKVQREVQEVPNLPEPPSLDSMRSIAEAKVKEANLLPEQIKSIESGSPSSRLISPNHLQSGLSVSLNKLNIRQIVDIGSKLQDINPSVKILDLIIDPNVQDSRYFDVTYRLISLNIPNPPPPPMPENEKKPGRRKNMNKIDESSE